MRYRATMLGFAGGQLRRPGDEFEFSGPPGSWMEPVDPSTTHEVDPSPEPAKAKRATPKRKKREVI